MNKAKPQKRLRENFVLIWERLVAQVQDKVLYDEYLLHQLSIWLTAMSRFVSFGLI